MRGKVAAANLFKSGNSQAVRLPKGFDFPEGGATYLHRDESTGDVVISRRPGAQAWAGFFNEQPKAEAQARWLSNRPLNTVCVLPSGEGEA